MIAATPVTDTIKRAGEAGRGRSRDRQTDRERLWAAQTPQVFRAEALREALDATRTRWRAATDDAMLVERPAAGC